MPSKKNTNPNSNIVKPQSFTACHLSFLLLTASTYIKGNTLQLSLYFPYCKREIGQLLKATFGGMLYPFSQEGEAGYVYRIQKRKDLHTLLRSLKRIYPRNIVPQLEDYIARIEDHLSPSTRLERVHIRRQKLLNKTKEKEDAFFKSLQFRNLNTSPEQMKQFGVLEPL